MEASFLTRYGDEPLLSPEEVQVLAQAIEAGRAASQDPSDAPDSRECSDIIEQGLASRERMIRANVRLVAFWAKRTHSERVGMDDLLQAGMCGLITAVDRYDWRRGFRFSTYASWWIRQALQRCARDGDGLIRVPTELAADNDQLLTVLSLDAPVPGAQDLQLAQTIADDTDVADECAALVDSGRTPAVLSVLTPTEQRVLVLRSGLDGGGVRTYRQVAAQLAISVQASRTLELGALAKLRHPAARSVVLATLSGPGRTRRRGGVT